MRLSELLASTVVDDSGRSLGPVRDIRLVESERTGEPRFRAAGLVIGGGRFAAVAHAWGFAEGRAMGPWLLRRLTRGAVARARFVPAERVVDWGPGQVRISAAADGLAPLADVGEQ